MAVYRIPMFRRKRRNPTDMYEYPWILECAAGIIDPGETPDQVVVREAKEEAGVTVTAIEPIADYFASPGGISEKLYVFCGRVV